MFLPVSWDSCSRIDTSYTDLSPEVLLDAASSERYGHHVALQPCKAITEISLLPPSLYIHRFLRSHSLRRVGFAQDAGSASISFDTPSTRTVRFRCTRCLLSFR